MPNIIFSAQYDYAICGEKILDSVATLELYILYFQQISSRHIYHITSLCTLLLKMFNIVSETLLNFARHILFPAKLYRPWIQFSTVLMVDQLDSASLAVLYSNGVCSSLKHQKRWRGRDINRSYRVAKCHGYIRQIRDILQI